MGADNAAIIDALGHFVNRALKNKTRIMDVQVKSVDEKKRTCIVETEDGEIEDLKVRLISEVSDGHLSLPDIGSTITIMFNDETSAIMIGKTWLSKQVIIVGDTEITMENGRLFLTQGKMEVTLEGGKVSIKNDSKSLLNVLVDFMTDVSQLIVDTGSGPGTVQATFVQKFQQRIQELKQVMK